MLHKLLFMVTIFNLTFGTNFEIPRQDVIILETGERVSGQITWVSDEVVTIKTEDSERNVIRNLHIDSARDIVETGLVTTKRHSGWVYYFGEDYMEIETSSGNMRIKRPLVKKIILSQEPNFRL